MIKPILLPIAALGAAALLGTAAAAQPVGGVTVLGQPPSDIVVKAKPVRFDDINANSPDGARILFRRIRHAAELVCSPAPAHLSNLPQREEYEDFARCELDSINLAVNDVNSPALNSYVDGLR